MIKIEWSDLNIYGKIYVFGLKLCSLVEETDSNHVYPSMLKDISEINKRIEQEATG